MSQRGSRSAKFIGGKTWKVGNASNKISKLIKEARNRNIKNNWSIKYQELSIQFNVLDFDSLEYQELKEMFLNILTVKEKLIALSNVEAFKKYCEENELTFNLYVYVGELFCIKNYDGYFIEALNINPTEIITISELVDFEIKIKRMKLNETQKALLIGHIKFLYKHIKKS